mmetsp:Transcript_121035/g.376271  ORF Transcript_121035/g.376271 Transcript_121035/m.376271 type:complete len:219 (+) Transcript_121035:1015-1671(+)
MSRAAPLCTSAASCSSFFASPRPKRPVSTSWSSRSRAKIARSTPSWNSAPGRRQVFSSRPSHHSKAGSGAGRGLRGRRDHVTGGTVNESLLSHSRRLRGIRAGRASRGSGHAGSTHDLDLVRFLGLCRFEPVNVLLRGLGDLVRLDLGLGGLRAPSPRVPESPRTKSIGSGLLPALHMKASKATPDSVSWSRSGSLSARKPLSARGAAKSIDGTGPIF